GIVASRLVDRFHRPTIMLGINEEMAQGSARSINGFHLAHALSACGEHLISHGGHEMAAGMKLRADQVDAFREAFCDYAAQHITEEMLVPELRLESLAELRQINEALVRDLDRLG